MAVGRRLLAELLGSAFLAALVIGSGIAAQRLSPGDTGLELLENAAATAAGLYAIILMFGPVSGGHFNPVVSLVDAAFGGLRRREAACVRPGPDLRLHPRRDRRERHVRRGGGEHLEQAPRVGWAPARRRGRNARAVIFALARTRRSASGPAAVGAYIGAAYWFTSSTSFANPAISVGRMFSDTFAGIAPAAVPGFVVAQLIGGAAAIGLVRVLYPDVGPEEAAEVVLPHAATPARRG